MYDKLAAICLFWYYCLLHKLSFTHMDFLHLSGLLNRFLWMQDMYPPCGEESLLFKTSVGFIDHLQEILGALLTGCTLVIPSFSVLKENILSIPAYLQVQ